MKAIQQLLHEVDWGNLDILVLDMPPGTGDTQLTITQQVILDGELITCIHLPRQPTDRHSLGITRVGHRHNPAHACGQRCGQGHQHVQKGQHKHPGLGSEHVTLPLSALSRSHARFRNQREGRTHVQRSRDRLPRRYSASSVYRRRCRPGEAHGCFGANERESRRLPQDRQGHRPQNRPPIALIRSVVSESFRARAGLGSGISCAAKHLVKDLGAWGILGISFIRINSPFCAQGAQGAVSRAASSPPEHLEGSKNVYKLLAYVKRRRDTLPGRDRDRQTTVNAVRASSLLLFNTPALASQKCC